MTFPRRLLRDDEIVVFDLRPHWIRLVTPAMPVAVVLGGCVAIFVIWRSAPAWFGLVLGAIFAVDLVYFATKFLAFRSTSLVLTSSRIVYRRGVLRRYVREIPLASVRDTSYTQRIIERLVGSGMLTVESAGERDPEPFRHVAHPAAVQGAINEAIANLSRPPAVPAPPHIPTELERLDDLQRRGVITEDERLAQQDRLLGGR